MAFQSCSKCGQCVVSTTTGTNTEKDTGSVFCGDNNNESGSYYKAAKLSCEQTAQRFKENNPNTTTTQIGVWESAK